MHLCLCVTQSGVAHDDDDDDDLFNSVDDYGDTGIICVFLSQ